MVSIESRYSGATLISMPEAVCFTGALPPLRTARFGTFCSTAGRLMLSPCQWRMWR